MAFECRLLGVVRLSIIGRFVFLESAIFRRFVWDFSEIWICGLYLSLYRTDFGMGIRLGEWRGLDKRVDHYPVGNLPFLW